MVKPASDDSASVQLSTATFVAATVSVVVGQLALVFFVYARHVFAPVI
jgi:hypothetical protein